MTNLVRTLAATMALLAGVFLLLVTALMFVDVIGRYVFNSPLAFTVEMVELMMGLAITFGLALTTLNREHIRVDLLSSVVPALVKRLLDLLADIATLMFMALIAWKLFEKAAQTMRDGLFTQILGMPVYPVVYLMSFSAAAALIVSVWLIVKPGSGGRDHPGSLGE